jgi:outer membrane protein OmpA-like peptidoglycan-associated protein
MKKKVNGILSALALTFTGMTNAQAQENNIAEGGFNKWSVEFSSGYTKPQRPMSSGYFTSTPSLYVLDLGGRYMFNNKFGLKADFGFNSFEGKKNSLDFKTKYYRADLQAVANLGRIMNFETWTKTLGLLGHAGFGLSQMENSNSLKDRMGNFIAGVTGQIKVTDRVVLTGDFTTILNASQDFAFDGARLADSRGFSGVVFNGTVGVTVYLGKGQKHADWVVENTSVNGDLQERIVKLENQISDGDKDGVADYLDLDLNTPSGGMVDVKGRLIDKNNNKISDDVEEYIKSYNMGSEKVLDKNMNAKELINGGYVNTFFEYNMSTPTDVSTDGIDFIRTYLRNNPSAKVDIIGHADEIGNVDYNNKLSEARAKNVKGILMKAGVDSSRLNVIGAGEDASVDKDSEGARKLSRRVTFKVK